MCRSGPLRAFAITARDGSVLNPRFPAPVNTYNPTVHALVDALFAALGPIVPGKVRADGSGSRSIIIGGHTSTGKSYVQYEIIAGGGGARATKDGACGITVNQSNARIAPIEIIESEFPTRVLALRADPRFRRRRPFSRRARHQARISQSRRRAVLDPLDEARHSTERCAGGGTGRPGDIWINPGSDQAKRLPTRYADYPLQEATFSASTRPAAAVMARRCRDRPSACSPMCVKATCRRKPPSATIAWR